MREFGVTDQYLGRQGARRCCCARGGKHLRRRPETVSRRNLPGRNLPGRLSFTADDRRQRSRTRFRAARDRALLASRVGVDVRNREHDRGRSGPAQAIALGQAVLVEQGAIRSVARNEKRGWTLRMLGPPQSINRLMCVAVEKYVSESI